MAKNHRKEIKMKHKARRKLEKKIERLRRRENNDEWTKFENLIKEEIKNGRIKPEEVESVRYQLNEAKRRPERAIDNILNLGFGNRTSKEYNLACGGILAELLAEKIEEYHRIDKQISEIMKAEIPNLATLEQYSNLTKELAPVIEDNTNCYKKSPKLTLGNIPTQSTLEWAVNALPEINIKEPKSQKLEEYVSQIKQYKDPTKALSTLLKMKSELELNGEEKKYVSALEVKIRKDVLKKEINKVCNSEYNNGKELTYKHIITDLKNIRNIYKSFQN